VPGSCVQPAIRKPTQAAAVTQDRATAVGVWLAAAAVAVFQLSRPLSGLDMHVYWTAATEMVRGVSPYTEPRFVYPPFAAALLAPLGHVSWPAARSIGAGVAAAAILATVLMSARAFGVRMRSWQVAAITGVVVTGHLFFTATSLGNLSALIAMLLAGFYLGTSRDNEWVAGALLGASLAVKPMLLPVLVVPLVWMRWRMLLASAVAAIGLTGIGALVVPHSGWFWTRALPHLWSAHPVSFDPLNSTLSSVGHLVGAPVAVVLAMRILVVLVAAGVVVSVRIRRRRLDAPAAVTAASAALLAQFCAGGLTEDHFLLTLLPLVVTLVADETYLWPALAWPAAVGITSLLRAPTVWFGDGHRAQLSADTTVRLLGQLALLAALIFGRLGYGPGTWSTTRSGRMSSLRLPWSWGSRSASRCAGSSAGYGAAPAAPPGQATS
jgi:arabinofuranan 3-O-arabinosyltransferase